MARSRRFQRPSCGLHCIDMDRGIFRREEMQRLHPVHRLGSGTLRGQGQVHRGSVPGAPLLLLQLDMETLGQRRILRPEPLPAIYRRAVQCRRVLRKDYGRPRQGHSPQGPAFEVERQRNRKGGHRSRIYALCRARDVPERRDPSADGLQIYEGTHRQPAVQPQPGLCGHLDRERRVVLRKHIRNQLQERRPDPFL